MAILDDRDAKTITSSVVTGIAEFAAEVVGPKNEDAFIRVWPRSPDNNAHAGNSLGFLRYLSRSPATALRVDFPTAYSLTLDRAVTAPNAVIGISIGNNRPTERSNWKFIFPGDTIAIPGGATRAWIFNADTIDQITYITNPLSFPVGYCGFLAGIRPNLPAPTQSNPIGEARIIHAGFQGGPSGLHDVVFNRGRMKNITVRLAALGTNRAPLATTSFLQLITLHALSPEEVATDGALESETLDSLPQSLSYVPLGDRYISGRNAHGDATFTLTSPRLHVIQFASGSGGSIGLVTWSGGTAVSVLYRIESAD